MNEIMKQYMQKISPSCQGEDGENYFYSVFRIIISLLFFMHGAQKLFGWMGGIDGNGATPELASLAWFAGLIEVAVGLLILLGVFTRIAALVAVIEMIVAYFVVHLQMGFNPLLNGGELALMFLVSFLIMIYYGAGKWSLEKSLNRIETF